MEPTCRTCGGPALGYIQPDPYDLVSGSPILQEVAYCFQHYNERVIAALLWIKRVEIPERQPQAVKHLVEEL